MTIRENIAWLNGLSKGYRMQIFLNIILGIASVCFSLIFILLSKSLVDLAVAKELGDGFWEQAAWIICVLLAQQFCSIIRGRIDSYTTTKMMNTLRERLFSRVMHSLWRGKELFHTGDITTRLEGDVRKACETLCKNIPLVLITSFEFLFSFIFLLTLDSRLAWVLFIIMPITILLSKSYVLKMRSLTHSIREVDSSLQSHIQEQVQHRNVINSMGNTSGSIASLHNLGNTLFKKTMRRTDYLLFSKSILRFGFSAGYLTAFLWGVEGLSSGVISFGVMTAFLQLVAKVQVPVVELSSQLSNIAQTTSSIERLCEIDNLEIEEQGEPKILDGAIGIKAENITFRYTDGEIDILSDFSYDFTPNNLHVIVGETGGGKSTLLRLILGFFSPQKGDIKIYNNSETIKCSPLTRANLVYVPQGNTLISGTIKENILLGNPSATDQEIKEAIHIAVADFIYRLPNGLDTVCGERGAGLSEGEAQRVAIARGLLRKGGLLLFDEPTSALDKETERLLIERLTAYAQNRTLIMVTHREKSADICSSVVKLKKNI